MSETYSVRTIKSVGLFLLLYGSVGIAYGMYVLFFIPFFKEGHHLSTVINTFSINYEVIPLGIYFLLISITGGGIFFLKENARRVLIILSFLNLLINSLRIIGLCSGGSWFTLIDSVFLAAVLFFITRAPVKKHFHLAQLNYQA